MSEEAARQFGTLKNPSSAYGIKRYEEVDAEEVDAENADTEDSQRIDRADSELDISALDDVLAEVDKLINTKGRIAAKSPQQEVKKAEIAMKKSADKTNYEDNSAVIENYRKATEEFSQGSSEPHKTQYRAGGSSMPQRNTRTDAIKTLPRQKNRLPGSSAVEIIKRLHCRTNADGVKKQQRCSNEENLTVCGKTADVSIAGPRKIKARELNNEKEPWWDALSEKRPLPAASIRRHAKDEDMRECTFHPSKTKEAWRAMKHPKCQYGDWMKRLYETKQGPFDVLKRLKHAEKESKKKLTFQREKEAYDLQQDKKQCPKCGLFQSYDEFKDKKRDCAAGCGMKYIHTQVWGAVSKSFLKRQADNLEARAQNQRWNLEKWHLHETGRLPSSQHYTTSNAVSS